MYCYHKGQIKYLLQLYVILVAKKKRQCSLKRETVNKLYRNGAQIIQENCYNYKHENCYNYKHTSTKTIQILLESVSPEIDK